MTFATWRTGVERYVWDQANGDPDVLRDLSWDNIHRGFAMISDPIPSQSTDAIGLLVAHRKINGRPSFIFLFALVDQGIPREIHPVVLQMDQGKFHWISGQNDPSALARYRNYSDGNGFAMGEDRFDSVLSGGEVVIHHLQTRAQWRLGVAPPETQ